MWDFLNLFSVPVLETSIRLATPLLLACLAGLFSERAGIFDIGLEGKMLIAAFFSAAISFNTGSVWLGPWGRYFGLSHLVDHPRAGLDHIPRQPTDLWRCNQFSRGWHDRFDCAKLVQTRRAYSSA
jgi:hypothetical protein